MNEVPAVTRVNKLLDYLQEKTGGALKVIERDDPIYIRVALENIPTKLAAYLHTHLNIYLSKDTDHFYWRVRHWSWGVVPTQEEYECATLEEIERHYNYDAFIHIIIYVTNDTTPFIYVLANECGAPLWPPPHPRKVFNV